MSATANLKNNMEKPRIHALLSTQQNELLSHDALAFLTELSVRFDPEREQLLSHREQVQARLNQGNLPDFPAETESIRASDWQIEGIPDDLLDRRVEITGPVDRKMIINALNSSARVFMADFEDSSAPTWENMIQGQVNLRDAVNRTISFDRTNGKSYRLIDDPAVLIVRPRGLHLLERHIQVTGGPISGALFDFGLFVYHNAKKLIEQGSGPYFYLPKLESYQEACWWNQVLDYSEDRLGLQRGTIKVTVLIETLHAGFQMDEILYELRSHIVGLNCGRWDYIFSYIKALHKHSDRVLPERSQVTMAVGFLRAYSRLLVKTCHRRGAFAMGGMAAQIPIKSDPVANDEALKKVRQDKIQEASNGHDGTWVAHPGLIPIAMSVFDEYLEGSNQLGRDSDAQISRDDLLEVPEGSITEQGVRNNIEVAILYLTAWLGGQGCVPIHHLMEDAATAEISRAQLWQWARYPAGRLDDGRDVTLSMIKDFTEEIMAQIKHQVGADRFADGHYQCAAKLFGKLIEQDQFERFLTIPAYELL